MVTELGSNLQALGYVVPAEGPTRLPLPPGAYGESGRPPVPTTLQIGPPPPTPNPVKPEPRLAGTAAAAPPATPEELLAPITVPGAVLPNLAQLPLYRPEAAVPVPMALAPPAAALGPPVSGAFAISRYNQPTAGVRGKRC